MAGVEYTFNIGPVSDAALRSSRADGAGTDATIGTKFEQAQAASLRSTALAGHASPACDGGGCLVFHGDGPGVTTLSIGEEEGVGDFLSRPVVDGTEFLEPPVDNFASVGEHDITTLAIGEEDGGFAAAPTHMAPAQAMPTQAMPAAPASIQIGEMQRAGYAPYEPASMAIGESSVEFAAPRELFSPGRTAASSGAAFADRGPATVPIPVAEGYGKMAPIYSPEELSGGRVTMEFASTAPASTAPTSETFQTPRAKPALFALDGSPVPDVKPGIAAPTTAIATTPVPMPEIKPATATFTTSTSPMPEIKPVGAAADAPVEIGSAPVAETKPEADAVDTSAASRSAPADTPDGASGGSLTIADILKESKEKTPTVSNGTISVGDYDAYMAGEGAPAPAGIYEYEFDGKTPNAEAAHSTPEMTPANTRDPAVSLGETQPEDATKAAGNTPAAAPESVHTTTFTNTPSGLSAPSTGDAGMIDQAIDSPEISTPTTYEFFPKPSGAAPEGTATSEGIVSESANVETDVPNPVYSTTFSAPPAELESMGAPKTKPDVPVSGVEGGDSPGLTDEDFRITTLALGEEEAGGG